MSCPQVDFTAALSVALQHPAVSSDPKNICTLLKVCKSWRAALQQSTAGHASIDLVIQADQLQYQPLELQQSHLPQLVGFAAWYSKYQGLVKALSISFPTGISFSRQGSAQQVAETMSLSTLELSLQCAALAAAQQSRPTQLRSFNSRYLCSYNILSALPAASLTELELFLMKLEDRCVEAIGRLSSLRQLRLTTRADYLGPNSIQHLAGLSQLTQLQLLCISSAGQLQLPKQIQELKLLYAAFKLTPCIKLEYLTRLQRLQLNCGEPAAGAALPAQLQELEIKCDTGIPSDPAYSAMAAFNVAALRELRVLTLTGSEDSADQLQQLAGHPRLQQLALNRVDWKQVSEAALVCQSIPQLCSLAVADTIATVGDFFQLAKQVAMLTGLTKLELNVRVIPDDTGLGDGGSVCQHLARLTQLRELTAWYTWGPVSENGPAAAGAHHLSLLTALTKLDIGRGSPIIDETLAVQLAVTLTNLEWLRLTCDKYLNRWCSAPLPAIGRLTRLQYLSMGGLSHEVALPGLSYLTGLTRLTYLFGFEAAGRDALDALWAAIRAKQPATE